EVAADVEAALGGGHRGREPAMHRVVGQQVRQGAGVGQVVHRHEVDVGDAGRLGGPDDVATDPAESVDAHANLRHQMLPLPGQGVVSRRRVAAPSGGSARANVTAAIRSTPAVRRAVAAETNVAPVVKTSSTRMTGPITRSPRKAPPRLARRSCGVRPTWLESPLRRVRTDELTRRPVSSASAAASTSAWL